MESYLLVGPGVSFDYGNTIADFKNNSHSLTVYGDSKKLIDCNKLALPENAHVMIYAHGARSWFDYKLELCAANNSSADVFKIISKNKSLNVELSSCYSGAAINDVVALPKWSSLITFASTYYKSSSAIYSEIITNSTAFIHADNPFIKFAYYIFTNPETTKFAINSGVEGEVFTSSIDDAFEDHSITGAIQWLASRFFVSKALKDFDTTAIAKWQNNQLDNFLSFSQSIKHKLNHQRSNQIDELLELFKNDQYRSEWLSNFDGKRYQELLLFSMVYDGKFDAIKEILHLGVDVNVKLQDGKTPLMVASEQGNIDVIKFLLKAGASVNAQNKNGGFALYAAAENGYTAIAEELINAGASVNEKNFYGFLPLHVAAEAGHVELIKLLLANGALVNEKADYNISAVSVAAFNHNLEAVKLLLAAGVNLEENDHKFTQYLEEYDIYEHNQIEYILKHNNQASFALKAINNLEKQHAEVEKIAECLNAQSAIIIDNLNDICGEHGSYYSADTFVN